MDTIDPISFIFSSVFVLGLLGLFAVVLKHFSQKSFLQKYQQAGRLSVVETRYIDAKAKLVLIKRDSVEHLLMINDGKATIIEAEIKHEHN